MQNYFEPRQIIATLLKWWWILIAGVLIAVVIGFGISKKQTPVYKATTTVMIGGFIQAPQINRDDIVARDAFTMAYAEMATRQPVLDGAVQALDLNITWKQLGDAVNVAVVADTPLIEISAEANSPQGAQAIAGEIAAQLILLSQTQDDQKSNIQFIQQEVENLQIRIAKGRERLDTLQTQATSSISPQRLDELRIEIETLERFLTDWEDTYSRLLTLLESGRSQNRLTIIEEAQANSKPVSPNLPINIILSAGIGFGLALGVMIALDQFDDRIRTDKTLELDLGLNHLGTISKMKGKEYDGKLISAENPLFGKASNYRKILHNLGLIEKAKKPLKSLLVTSPRLREGKSLTVSNLGILLAQSGLKTIIVDVDWIKPVQHTLFDVSNENGLMDLLATADMIAKDTLQTTGIPNLQLLTAGSSPDGLTEVLEPKRLKQILTDLTKISDIILLDAPSTTIAESSVLFGLVEGVVLVIDPGRTTMTSVKQSMTSLYLTGGKLIGGILNRSPFYWSAT